MTLIVAEPKGEQKNVLETTCKERIAELLRKMHESGETVLLQTGDKNNRLTSTIKKQQQKPLESSALKPKKLEFTSSPSQQFQLLDSDQKRGEGEIGRFSIALSVCMTPREENNDEDGT